MKITKEEIKNISDMINIDLNEEEVVEVENSIAQIVKRFDEMLAIEDLEERKISSTRQVNQFNEDFSQTNTNELFENINNFDGEYVTTKKVIGDE